MNGSKWEKTDKQHELYKPNANPTRNLPNANIFHRLAFGYEISLGGIVCVWFAMVCVWSMMVCVGSGRFFRYQMLVSVM